MEGVDGARGHLGRVWMVPGVTSGGCRSSLTLAPGVQERGAPAVPVGVVGALVHTVLSRTRVGELCAQLGEPGCQVQLLGDNS